MRPTTRFLFLSFSLLFACETKTGEDTSGPDSTTVEPDDNDGGEDTDNEGDTGDSEPSGPTIWSGPTLTFEKDNFADHTAPENQDAITDNVVLTRRSQGGLFNIAVEESGSSGSPVGTQWAMGTTAEIEGLEFSALKTAANNQMKNVPGTAFVLHLTEEDVYLDVTFLGWSSGSSSGGGFSYERSTQN